MKIGFIGCGNMATAMIKGILDSGKVTAEQMIASAKSDQTREKISSELEIAGSKDKCGSSRFCRCGFFGCEATVLRRSHQRDQR